MKAVGIIPARYGSTRLPAKSLALINGMPLVRHVYERAKQASSLDEVIVATDDERILRAVCEGGGRAVMTGAHHRSGTERVAEVARGLSAEVILNIQGDEPLIHPDQIDQVASFLLAHGAVPMATVMTRLAAAEAANPNIVKVVVDQDGYALYFSRAPIPFIREATSDKRQATSDKRAECPNGPTHWKHIGLYGYQRDFLLRFPMLPPTPLEQAEQLEQLRALEHGYHVKALETPHDTIGVDTAEDLKRVEALLAT
ncbi:MAG: 3-deoxy-manno-octulosonate cytidylyltransferase [Omnitrophica WOR_2 bacterium RIFCSPLOWO2_02_FULL_63_16]|nr:MAG: 3-deoxy-manno-octulosonate cytidylyltransferase [Omnitrophica WOR_2 bacterium GWA2_63_20]OGX17007.1 MAG: 3-deoxy-manno-octulosonate cytidylyltransferase [Omnitrophica WOR_2 bacterium GWF2_63_9]OGX32620.1 MAG: 3-deoxy-manno-octulosonate cytidylyltransferase [Omnitrophica WOR_2 bacterium RIFCSPHIGHO2_12_FULL_64_13]OGX36742.1 MAG: 3-deoxy-manno-octulosonate cytidylyltransferase [Omnitrophica WOR_2 bacterium RIFCSPHIGHO2_02_FULL_63_39]OGX44874.1 MAG: 3-deoxy-manno-octulosonate cytidylyltran